MTTQTPQLPAACARRYRVERVLASGGFGTVVLAQQLDLERPVAIKLLHHDVLQRPEEVERFRSEARVTALLEHPHIVRVYDHGVDDGVPWIAFEYLPGRSLAAAIRERPFVPADALSIAAQVASALGAGHARGVLHRDVKPANVMEASRWRTRAGSGSSWRGRR